MSNPWWLIVLSSFSGAFFAFLFVKIEDYLTRIRTRKKQNYNALVRLEYIGNENLSIAHDNLFTADDIIRTSNITKSSQQVQINFNRFEDLVIRNDLLSELLNIDFINLCFILNIDARKINSSLESIMRSYDQINSGVFNRTMSLDNYLENLSGFIARLFQMKKMITGFIEDNITMIATAKVLTKYEKPRFTKFLMVILRNKNKSLSALTEEIEAEKKILKSQIEEISKKSKQRIDDLLKS
ncbi:MAG: hypothetical protein V1696_03545 [Candidatus Jorgensenbacteria bacterium]